MTSQLPHFWCLFLSYQLQKNTENGAAVTSLRSFLFRDEFRRKMLLCVVKFNYFNQKQSKNKSDERLDFT